ncbi:Gfo/Idh/MocA family protein [Lichenifustis flavocetrariae]|uniref:Gfo/Idh/MocA family oxidoreductase n=1 Tax=Lichenifustis flavocetrariae TaxID=2949735 RepID=A0AA41Z116_9HYPH|nr:Gfo/Idh/MocA family oxidoreductase [Lichenifustis flavocetrariae]MCW6508543.1 Gfo/Idh/MocA family oxidoreductase [Lichenifustis flavocetrariae]
MIQVALCGMGYWGKNLFRVLSNNADLHLKAVVDQNPDTQARLRAAHPGLQVYGDLATALPEVDAVVIATPVSSHYPLAAQAIAAGKHVLVEKPLCRTGDQAADLVEQAEAAGVTLMVDHTFLFHPVVRVLNELMGTGTLGQISYYDSQRINLGLFQPDVNVLWDLAPHDLSIIDHLFGSEPVEIEASGYCHVNPMVPDIGYLTLHYPNAMVAHLNLSWMSPVKVRRIAVGGSAKMVVWDDLNRDEPLKIYDSGISLQPQAKREQILPSYRIGSVLSPRLPAGEPLVDVVEHFRQVILGRTRSRMDGRQGLRIVRTLEWAQAALDLSLRRVRSRTEPSLRAVAAE